jgi:hypothetical protein
VADAHRRRVRGCPGQQHLGGGGVRERLQEVVLDGEDGLEALGLGEADLLLHLQEVTRFVFAGNPERHLPLVQKAEFHHDLRLLDLETADAVLKRYVQVRGLSTSTLTQ